MIVTIILVQQGQVLLTKTESESAEQFSLPSIHAPSTASAHDTAMEWIRTTHGLETVVDAYREIDRDRSVLVLSTDSDAPLRVKDKLEIARAFPREALTLLSSAKDRRMVSELLL